MGDEAQGVFCEDNRGARGVVEVEELEKAVEADAAGPIIPGVRAHSVQHINSDWGEPARGERVNLEGAVAGGVGCDPRIPEHMLHLAGVWCVDADVVP